MREITISKNEAGQRLDKFLHKYMKEAGSGFLYKMLRKKNITLNKKKADGTEKLNEGDVVALFMSDETIDKFMGSAKEENEYLRAFRSIKDIHIIYENEDILILDKPVGVLSQKATPEDISINEWAVGYLLAEGKLNESDLHTFVPSVCNRLDRNTGGMILIGKSLKGLHILSEVLKDRSIGKYYLAVCEGRPKKEMKLSGSLSKDEKTNKVTVRERKQSEEEKEIQTEYKLLSYGRHYSLLEVHLITGKTHQIRAHLAYAGYPLAGDVKYGGHMLKVAGREIKHQLLYAYKIIFPANELLGELSGQTLVMETPEIIKKLSEEDNADI